MKKRLSIKARITLWYAALILVLCAAALLLLLALADKAQRAHARNTLESATVVLMDELEIEHGQLEIDSDIDEIPNVYAALFDADGSLIYGKRRVQLPFAEGEMRRAQTGERSWYVLDTLLPALAEEFATERQNALAAVRVSLPEAAIDYAVRERDDGRAVWNVFFTQGTQLGVCKVLESTNEIRRVELFEKPEGAMNAAEAMAALAQSKGEMTVTELELDWEDGELIYEGEAELNGKRYEFEISVTGEMLEWERD